MIAKRLVFQDERSAWEAVEAWCEDLHQVVGARRMAAFAHLVHYRLVTTSGGVDGGVRHLRLGRHTLMVATVTRDEFNRAELVMTTEEALDTILTSFE